MSAKQVRPTPLAAKDSTVDDGELVRACLAGDEAAWETLVLRYERLIYSVALRSGVTHQDAVDVFQQVVVVLLEGLERLQRVESLTAWLVAATRRTSAAVVAERRRSLPIPDRHDRPSDDRAPDDTIDAVRRQHTLELAFERLDDRCRELLTALFLGDSELSYKEIAARWDAPIGSIGPTRRRCLAKLHRLYLEAGGDEP
ncbi:MAG: sigma-70 family RNA polymerase sigma factor [bacterium]|nr:sigma-70 family RNA polymerase sigma factor [bacterium]